MAAGVLREALTTCGCAGMAVLRSTLHCCWRLGGSNLPALCAAPPPSAVIAVGEDVDIGVAAGDRVLFSKYSSSGGCPSARTAARVGAAAGCLGAVETRSSSADGGCLPAARRLARQRSAPVRAPLGDPQITPPRFWRPACLASRSQLGRPLRGMHAGIAGGPVVAAAVPSPRRRPSHHQHITMQVHHPPAAPPCRPGGPRWRGVLCGAEERPGQALVSASGVAPAEMASLGARAAALPPLPPGFFPCCNSLPCTLCCQKWVLFTSQGLGLDARVSGLAGGQGWWCTAEELAGATQRGGGVKVRLADAHILGKKDAGPGGDAGGHFLRVGRAFVEAEA